MSVRVRPAAVADVGWLGEVSRASFDVRLHDYLISAQVGIDRFWEVVLAHPASFPDRCFLVAEGEDGARIGFADLTLARPGVGHLSYVCVVESARGRGVAVALLRAYVERNPDIHTLRLDVFDHNVAARSLYDRLGFVVESATSWWVADLDLADTPLADVHLDDLHMSLAHWEIYGFCELAGSIGDRSFRFGMVGTAVLRCFDSAHLSAPRIVAGVQRAFPAIDRAFVLTPGNDPPASALGELRRVNRSLGMSAPAIRSRLERT